MTWRWGSVWPVWLLAVAGAVAVAIAAPQNAIVWLPIVLGGCTLIAFAVQLAGPREPGATDRLAASVLGAVVVLAVASALLVPLELFG